MARNTNIGTRVIVSEGVSDIDLLTDKEVGGSGIVTALKYRLEPLVGPAEAGDGMDILFQGFNAIGGMIDYGALRTVFNSVADGSEEGLLVLRVAEAGVSTDVVTVSPRGLAIGVADSESLLATNISLDLGANAELNATRAAGAGAEVILSQNAYLNAGAQSRYKDTDEASRIRLNAGCIELQTAISGAADAIITWNTVVFIDPTGQVGINNISPSTALDVTGTVTATAFAGDGSLLTGAPVGSWNYPNYTSVVDNAYRVIIVDLDDPEIVSDWPKFRRAVRLTSWYAEIGSLPPVHGALLVNEAQDAIHWIDRDSDTLAIYMTFTSGAGNMIGNSTITDIDFLDFRLVVGVTGNAMNIDFLADDCWVYSSEPHTYKWNTDISGRNSGTGASIKYETAGGIKHSTVQSVAIGRDSEDVDQYQRSWHWIGIGTQTGLTIIDPETKASYNSADGQDVLGLAMLDGGSMWMTQQFEPTDPDQIIYYASYESLNYASFTQSTAYTQPLSPASGARAIGWQSATWTPKNIGVLAGSSPSGGDIAVVPSDDGVTFIYSNPANPDEGAHIFANSSYQSPYMKGVRHGHYSLRDLSDASGRGFSLTNVNGCTFGTGPLGGSVSFAAASSQKLHRAGDSNQNPFNNDGNVTVSFYYKTSFDHSGGEGGVISFTAGAGSTAYFLISISTSNQMRLATQNDTGGGSYRSFYEGPTGLNDGIWRHFCCVLDVDQNLQRMWCDGVEVGRTSVYGGSYSFSELEIGYATVMGAHSTGTVASLAISGTVWAEREIHMEYARMRAGLNGATTNTVVDACEFARVDQSSGIAAIGTGNKVQFWDVGLGLCIGSDDDATATLNDAAITTMVGVNEPHLIMGRSGKIEQVALSRSLGEMA